MQANFFCIAFDQLLSNWGDSDNVFQRSDESLINKALAGDERAWHQLVGRYQSMLYYYSLRLLGDPDDARDLLQDVLMVLCRNLAQFRGDSSLQEAQVETQQTEQLVQQQLRCLPPEQRLIVELRFYQQFTFDEIATQLALSSNTVKSRFYAALDKLKAQLEAHDVQ